MSAVTSVSDPKILQAEAVDRRLELLKSAHQRGLLEPYAAKLAGDWRDTEKWVQTLDDVVKMDRPEKWKFYQRHQILMLTLFTIAIDPQLDEGQKRSQIETELKGLSGKESVAFEERFDRGLAPCIAVHILRYREDAENRYDQHIHWYEPCRKIKEGYNYLTFLGWIEEVIDGNWPEDEKKKFLRYLFVILKSPSWRNCDHTLSTLREIVLNFSDEKKKTFSNLCEEPIAKRLTEVSADFLGLSRSCSEWKMEKFVQLFKRQGLQRPDAAQIATCFNMHNWQQLTDLPNFSDLAVRWITEIGKGPKKDEYKFYGCSSDVLDKVVTDEQIGVVAQAITEENLFVNFQRMCLSFRSRLLKAVIESQSDKLVAWFECIIADNSLSKIREVLREIEKGQLLAPAIAILFDGTRNNRSMLTIYAALDRNARRVVLQQPNGMSVLTDWARLCTSGSLDPSVSEEFVKDIGVLLDPQAAEDLRERLGSIAEDIIPRGIDFSTPAGRQQHATLRLKRNLEKGNIPEDRRAHFIDSIREDLKGEGGEWLPRLFVQLPKELWPYLYVYFIEDMCGPDYLRAKPPETEEIPKAPAFMPNLEEWIQTCSEALFHAADKEAVQRIYYATAATGTIEPVFKRFIERVEPERFVKTLNLTPYYHFCPFRAPLNRALRTASIDRMHYIAECLASETEYKQGWITHRVQDIFWSSLFLQSGEELSTVVKQLIEKLGGQFLVRFGRGLNQEVASLNATDPTYCKNLFSVWIKEVNDLTIFQDICKAYQSAGFDVIELLQPLDLTAIRKLEWTKGLDRAGYNYPWALAVKLMRHIRPELFYPRLFHKIESIFLYLRIATRNYFSSFDTLLKELDAMGLGEEFLERLFQPEREDLREGIKIFLQEDLLCRFAESTSPFTVQLLCKLDPKWKKRMIDTSREILADKKSREQWNVYPKEETIVQAYRALDKAGRLGELVPEMTAQLPEFSSDLAEVYQKFLKQG